MKEREYWFDESSLPFTYSDFCEEFDAIDLDDYFKAVAIVGNLSIKAEKLVIHSLLPHLKKRPLSQFRKNSSNEVETIGDSVVHYTFTRQVTSKNYWGTSHGMRGVGLLDFVCFLLNIDRKIKAFCYINKVLQLVGSSSVDLKKRLFPNLSYIECPAKYLYVDTVRWDWIGFYRSKYESALPGTLPALTGFCEERVEIGPSNEVCLLFSPAKRASTSVNMALFYDSDIDGLCMACFEPKTVIPYREDEIRNHKDHDVLMCEQIDWIACSNNLVESFSSKVVPTWIGSNENYTSLDWSCLAGRRVHYVFSGDDVSSVKKALYVNEICKRNNSQLVLLPCNKKVLYEGNNVFFNLTLESELSVPELKSLLPTNDFCPETNNHTLKNSQTQSLPIKKVSELKSESTKKRYLVEPLFKEGEIVLLVAKQKVGKSLFALDLSMMLATKGVMGERLKSPLAKKVLYIDAEMPETEVRRRVETLKNNYNNVGAIEANLDFFFQKGQKRRLNLLEKEDQDLVSNTLNGHKLLVLDNLGKMIPHRGELNEQKWGAFFDWMEKVANHGVTVLLIHHENKAGGHRGTGKITDDVGLVVSLKSVQAINQDSNAIKVEIEDSRFLYGKDCESFILEYGPERRTVIVGPDTGSHSQSVEFPQGGNYYDTKTVLLEEINKFDLKDVHIHILATLRSGAHSVARKDFDGFQGLKPRTLQKEFSYLCDKRLIIRYGNSRDARYRLPTSLAD